MPQPDRPRGHVTGRVTIAVVVAAIACCGIPLLVAAGLLTTTGLGLRNPVLVGGGGRGGRVADRPRRATGPSAAAGA